MTMAWGGGGERGGGRQEGGRGAEDPTGVVEGQVSYPHPSHRYMVSSKVLPEALLVSGILRQHDRLG